MATKRNLVMDQGADFSQSVTLENDDIDLNDYDIRGKMRKHHTSLNAYSFTCVASNSSTLVFMMGNADTSDIPDGNYVYDVEIEAANTVYRVIEGLITVTPGVTY
jgi:hypothetical protein